MIQELKLGVPSDKQKLFLLDKHRYVGFGGARGGGKSWAIRTKAIGLAYRYPGIKMIIIRKSYPELRENHIIPLCEELHVRDVDPQKRLARYNDSRKDITFPNGSRIIFQYCENDADAERLQGTEADVLFVDEATMQTEERMKRINAIVRGVNDKPKRTYYTFNPGGVGHQWVKRLFIDRNYNTNENPDDYTFIQSLVTDNKVLMKTNPDYIKQLEALPPKIREAWLYGRWDVFEGQAFPEFKDDPDHYIDRKWTHVIQPFEVPRDWKIYLGYDWGYSRPFALEWVACSTDGTLYVIEEFYGCTQTPNEGVKYSPEKIAECINEIENTNPNLKGRFINRVADPAIFDEQKGESIAQMMENKGVVFDKADNSRISGKMQVHYRLSFNDRGIPKLYVFNNCRHLIRTLPLLLYDEKKVEDVDTSMEDHIYDTLRYILMESPISPPIRQKVVKDVREDPLDLWKDNYSGNLGRYDYITF